MPVVSPEKLASLQSQADCVRNICVLAHVDHGKTSLTDSLLATNGIISPKLAGKIRYLDSRPDEQARGITMEASAISLYFSMLRRPTPDAAAEIKEYLVNLIDSPGHIDFSSEVSTASRLCDGAVVLVDAVEGVCSQTVTVLRQTWTEKLKSLLVINKIDRLVTELKLTPNEAYVHLNKLLEQVNAVLGSFFQGERMEADLNWREQIDRQIASAATREADRVDRMGETDDFAEIGELHFQERDDEDIYFEPKKNNVIFSSAMDGWAFTVRQFAVLYEKKLGIRRTTTERFLWGDFYLDPKTKRIRALKHQPKNKGRLMKPLFVQLVLEPLWAVYQAACGGKSGLGEPDLLEKITKSLDITVPLHVVRARDSHLLLTTIFASWIPISTALLVSIVESLPSPKTAQVERLPDLFRKTLGSGCIHERLYDVATSFTSSSSDPVIAYVSKMVSVPESALLASRERPGSLTGEEARELARKRRAEIIAKMQSEASSSRGSDNLKDITETMDTEYVVPTLQDGKLDPEHLIGFARIYSGRLSVGQSIWVIPPKWSPSDPHAPPLPAQVTVQALYMFMGRNVEPLDSVPAGVVFGIGGLEGHILKSGTLCSQLEGAINLGGLGATGQPIVRVALEPVNAADLDKMIDGLQLLVQSDPCAEYEQFETGEHVLLTAGELHLERCLTDLQERFARCQVQASAPIVPFRETIVRADEMRPPADKELGRGVVVAISSSKQITVKLRVAPLPSKVTEFLNDNADTTRRVYQAGGGKNYEFTRNDVERRAKHESTQGPSILGELSDFKAQFVALLDKETDREQRWKSQVENIISFGPRRNGPNLLIDATPGRIMPKMLGLEGGEAVHANGPTHDNGTLTVLHFSDKITYAFQLATAQGPLCSEPVEGIAVFVEEISIAAIGDEGSGVGTAAHDQLPRLTGELIKTFQQAIRAGFLDWSPRIMRAMYSVEIQAATEVLGRVYDVLTRRRGRVLAEAMREGTPFFTITAVLPVAESFGFADDMRKRTSGAAQPQLIFAGFEVLDEDPLWVPFTEDDLEDLGELADKENVAKRYMDAVRRRKGLLVEGRNVATDAGKQKTLKR